MRTLWDEDEPCPALAAETREDMALSALDALVKHGECGPGDLARYSFTAGQIDKHAEAAIAAARRRWEEWGCPRVARPPAPVYVASGTGAAIPVRGRG